MSQESSAKYDETYKRLFSNQVLVEQLVRDFVDEELADAIDFETLENIETTSYSQDLEKRDNDKILKIKRKGGGEIYLLLMLEFQSSNDFSMAVRILSYVARLYEEQVKQQGNVESMRLPAIFPVVIYNGEYRWSAKQSLGELRDGSKAWREATAMFDLRYHLVDCARAPKIKASLVSLLFQMEHPEDLESFKTALTEFASLVRQVVPEALIKDFQTWLRYVLETKIKVTELSDDDIALFFPEDGMFKMNTVRLEKVFEQWQQETAERSLEKGREEGRVEGSRDLLGLLLLQKFGENDARKSKLAALDLETIEAATTIVLRAPDESSFWAELFEE